MNKNKKLNIEDALAFILDGESDFEDLSESDSEFESDVSTAVVSNTKVVHDDNNDNIIFPISESLTQESSTRDDMLYSNSSAPLPKKSKIVNNKKQKKASLPLWKKVTLDNDLIGDIAFQEVPIEPIPDETTTPYEYFKMFVDDNLRDIIAEQSSFYSCQSSGTNISVTSNEIESFIGVFFRMGLVKLPSVRSYWETFMNYDGVSSILSRNRFLSILRYLHFVDNLNVTDEVKKNDRAWKLRPWLEKLRENFLKVSPEENQSVDEIMVPFKGRSFLKQYLPKKPNKWGFKLWARCGVSGYLYDFDLYQGKEIKKKDEVSPHGVGASVVIKMTSTLPENHNFKIFADNYFSSLPLLDELKKRRIWYVGTARLKRLNKCPFTSEKELKNQGRGSFDYRTDIKSNNIAVSWIDNKVVTLISSFASIEPINSVRRYDRKTCKHIMVKQPYIVQFYNKNMGGVDKLDMMCSFYKPNLKCHRWYIYVWAHTLLIALSNAWFLYRRDLKIICPSKKFMPLKNFQAAVASSLVTVVKRKAGRASLDAIPIPTKRAAAVQSNPTKDIRLDGFDHLPTYSDKRQRCKKCKTGFSYIRCKKCNVWLCLNKDRNCYHDYH
ncbi:piggyBac transposable element-derived protein 3-like [Hydra vulgaris]|uniref:PiggyBac transposable element-derived protein 3-like n=1 Tax=Hydra vulgaris TaxID=6087 RepID=A0ABM4CTK2_HYDVU